MLRQDGLIYGEFEVILTRGSDPIDKKESVILLRNNEIKRGGQRVNRCPLQRAQLHAELSGFAL